MDARRTTFWMLFLGAAAVLAVIPEYFFPPEEEPLLVPPASRDGSTPAPAPAPPPTPATEQAVARAPGGSQLPASVAPPPAAVSDGSLFSAHSWRAAPPPAPVRKWAPPPSVAATPVAVAPALPFAFIGKMDDARRLLVFLTRGEKIYTVTVGDVIDGTYRVERIADSEMVLTYLPLNVRQTLAVGGRL